MCVDESRQQRAVTQADHRAGRHRMGLEGIRRRDARGQQAEQAQGTLRVLDLVTRFDTQFLEILGIELEALLAADVKGGPALDGKNRVLRKVAVRIGQLEGDPGIVDVGLDVRHPGTGVFGAGPLEHGPVAIDGDVAIIGAVLDDDPCPGSKFCSAGSAYIFRYDGAAWIEEQKIPKLAAAADDES